MESGASPDQVAAAISRIPSGLGILTAAHRGRSTGTLVSWFQQASFQPLMVTVCVRKGRPIESLIDGSGQFLLNVLGEDCKPLLRHFGRGFPVEEDAFERLPVEARQAGIRLSEAIAYVECEVITATPAGDHTLYLGEAFAGQGDLTARPQVHLRKTALRY